MSIVCWLYCMLFYSLKTLFLVINYSPFHFITSCQPTEQKNWHQLPSLLAHLLTIIINIGTHMKASVSAPSTVSAIKMQNLCKFKCKALYIYAISYA
jgi:hypothetical protein